MKKLWLKIIACACVLMVAVACADNVTLLDRVQGIVTDGDDLIVMTEEDLSDLMGIEEEEYSDFAYLASMDALTGREFIVLRAVDEDAAEALAEKLQSYYEDRLHEMENYLPETYKLIKACSVQQEGLLVILDIGEQAQSEVEQLLAEE